MTSAMSSQKGTRKIERPKVLAGRSLTRSKKLLRNQSFKAKSKRQRGLRRPTSQISYNIPRDIQALFEITNSGASTPSSHPLAQRDGGASRSGSRSSTPTPSSDLPPLIHLSRIVTILDLIHRRNKNQHRNQNFYKWLNLLRRSIKNLTSLHQRLESINASTKTSATKSAGGGNTLNAESIRKTFELRSELRSQIEVSEEWIRENLVSGCFVSFSSVVADNQFANLGIVLMGVLGDVVAHVGGMRRIDRIPAPITASVKVGMERKTVGAIDETRGGDRSGNRDEGERFGRSILGVSTLVTGPDQGEVVERIYSDIDADGDEEGPGVAVKNVVRDEGVKIQRRRDSNGSHSLERNDAGEGMILDKKEMSSSTHVEIPFAATATTTFASVPLPSQMRQSNSTIATAPDTETAQSTVSSSPKKPQTHSQVNLSAKPKPESRPTHPTQKPSQSETKIKPRSPVIIQDNIPERKEQRRDKQNEKKKKKKKGNAIDDLFGGFF